MKSWKIIKNVILDIIIFILVILILLAMYGFIQTKVMKKSYPNYFGYTYFQILTGSMEPAIYQDDIVFVRVTDKIKENDIISFENDKEIITHRVIEVVDDGYVTKGDNNNASDGVIEKKQVIGKVKWIGKKWGKIKSFILEPVVIIPLILVIGLFSWYMALGKEKGADEDEK